MTEPSVHDVPASDLPFLMAESAQFIGSGSMAVMLRRAVAALASQAAEIERLKATQDSICRSLRDEVTTRLNAEAERDAAERAYNGAKAEMVKAEDALLATVGLLEVVQDERDRWKKQSDDWQRRGWELGKAAEAAEAERDALRAQLADAVAKEREACALVAGRYHEAPGWEVAAAIRARGKPPE